MEQIREVRYRCTHIWPTDFQQRHKSNSVELKTVFSTNDSVTTGQLCAKKVWFIPYAKLKKKQLWMDFRCNYKAKNCKLPEENICDFRQRFLNAIPKI